MRLIRTCVLTGLLLGALTWASVPTARQLLTGDRLDYASALGACAAAVAWLAVLWFLACLTCALLTRLPGGAGRLALLAARRITPSLIRQLLEATLGTTLIVTTTAPLAHAVPAAVTSSPTVPVRPAASPTYAAAPPAHAGAFANGADMATAPKLPPPDRPGDNRPSRPPRKADEPRVVAVHAGDTLWDIAARALPGEPSDEAIAAAWPRWYATNRAVIGADPDVIRPGQQLRAP